MVTPNKTYFCPTHPAFFMDILTYHGVKVDYITLYDLARFVEDFVLSQKVSVSEDLYNMLRPDFIQNHLPQAKSVINTLYDDIKSYFSEWNKEEQFIKQKIHTLDNKIALLKKEEEKLKTLLEEKIVLLTKLCKMLEKHHVLIKHPLVFYEFKNTIPEILLRLYLSKELTDQEREILTTIDDTVRSLFQIGVTISPGFGFVIPTLKYCIHYDLSRSFYNEVALIHKLRLNQLERFSKSYFIYIPPLLSILLQRCKKREHLPEQLLKLRNEFSDLRREMAIYEDELQKHSKLKDKLDIIEDMEESRKKLVEKISGSKKTSIIRRIWSVVKDKSLWTMFTKLADIVLQWDENRLLISRVSRFVDIYNLSLEIEEYDKLLVKIFGHNSINYETFEKMKPIIQLIEHKHFPDGRKKHSEL